MSIVCVPQRATFFPKDQELKSTFGIALSSHIYATPQELAGLNFVEINLIDHRKYPFLKINWTKSSNLQ